MSTVWIERDSSLRGRKRQTREGFDALAVGVDSYTYVLLVVAS